MNFNVGKPAGYKFYFSVLAAGGTHSTLGSDYMYFTQPKKKIEK